MVTLWCIFYILGVASVVPVICDEGGGVYVEVSVLVASDYNESRLYENLYQPTNPNASGFKTLNASNATGNVTNATNSSNDLSHLNHSNNSIVPIVGPIRFSLIMPNSFLRILSVAPILCVIGFDYNCFNDTNVTRLADTNHGVAASDSTDTLPVGVIAGLVTGVCVTVIVTVFCIWSRGFKKKEPVKVEKKLVIPIKIEWPPRNKKLIPGNGMHPLHYAYPIVNPGAPVHLAHNLQSIYPLNSIPPIQFIQPPYQILYNPSIPGYWHA